MSSKNTHRAFVSLTEHNKETYDDFGNRTVTRVQFDEPKNKMIASGDQEYCERALEKYIEKHPGTTGGVIEALGVGDPWEKDWNKI